MRGSVTASELRRRITTRLLVIQYGMVGVFGLLALAFWYFQVIDYQKYWEEAENNHQRTLALRAPRGILFDRDDRVLVENRDSFNISIVREHTKDLDGTIRLLARVTGVSEADMRETVRRSRSLPRYQPITVISDATMAQVAAVTARRLDTELPDVIVEHVPTRHYPQNALAAHLLGYVGEVKEEQLAANADLRSGSLVGQWGVERVYNAMLMGNDGSRRVVVNSVGREIRQLDETPPSEGRRLRLTIDLDLQKATEEAFAALGYAGSAVILDPRNGEVLSYVSLPAFDPNKFAAGIDAASWKALNTDKLHPLQNRAIQGTYSPGSTFKIAVATAALEEGVAAPGFTVTCRGAATFYGRPFLCHLKGGHGTVDMVQAIEKSCNVYFYTVGNMLGIDRINRWATALGLGTKSGIDLPGEVEGLVPSTAWKKAKTGDKWYAGETISVSIGQGQVSVTPVSMAIMISTIANGGTRVVPHLVREEDPGTGWQRVPAPPPSAQIALKPETVATLHEGLWRVVNGAGTGGRAKIPGRDVAGKTGTAQVISIQGAKAAAGRTELDLRDHGWFVFFAPKDNPEIAGVILAEHAEHGSTAAPIAKYVMETYFAKKDGLPMPQFQAPAGQTVVDTVRRP
jgi:penicillin-binding protein 2